MENLYLERFPGTWLKTELIRENNGKDSSSSIKPLTSSKMVYDYIRAGLENKDSELFISILLSTSLVPLGVNLVAIGGLNSAGVRPREVFKAAIIASASCIILAHNHPSGNSVPSQDDINVTKRMIKAGKILGIKIQDHIIVGRDCYYSMQDNEDFRKGG